MADKKPAAEKAAAAQKMATEAAKVEPEAKAPTKAAPDHGKRLDALERQHAALLDIARANGWSLPE